MATSAATACGRRGWASRRCCRAAGTSACMASQFNTDGVRPHSAAQRTLGNLRLGWVGDQDTVTLLLNSVDQPAQDPLGLTRAQFDADPYQTTPQAIAVRHAQDQRPDAGRRQLAPPLHRCRRLARERAHRLCRPARRDAVAGHSAGHAGQPASPGRRDRLRPRLLRARRAAGLALGQRLADRRRGHRAAERRPARLRELHRQRRRPACSA